LLADWLDESKRRKNGPHQGRPCLTPEQIAQLDQLGIDWAVNDDDVTKDADADVVLPSSDSGAKDAKDKTVDAVDGSG